MPSIKDWPASAVQMVPVSQLIPYARNARTHSDEQVAQIAASIREWGWTVPVLIDEDNSLIAGHGRLAAAQRLGLAEVPAMRALGWSATQKRAYVLADNKLAENAAWDTDLLKIELSDLGGDGFELSLLGFNGDELAALLADKTEGLTDPDDVPDLAEAVISVAGTTWTLGRHRLRCGDSTKADDVAALLNGVEPHLMVTDPPYGVEYDANWRNEVDRANGKPYGASAVGVVENDDRADWSDAWALFPGDVAYVWCAPGPLNCKVHDSLESSGIMPRMQIVWAKSQLVIGRGHYHIQHENCWYAVRKGAIGHWSGDRKQTTVWQIDKPKKSETGHSTQKPVECMKRPIENNSTPGQAVYEPFSGSGTTIIAAEMAGRSCYAMELSPAYVDMAVRRWQQFTGEQAFDESGRSFAEAEAGAKAVAGEICAA